MTGMQGQESPGEQAAGCVGTKAEAFLKPPRLKGVWQSVPGRVLHHLADTNITELLIRRALVSRPVNLCLLYTSDAADECVNV